MTTTLWRGRGSAVVETHGRVDWVGEPTGSSAFVDRVVDVEGVILPAFRDAHVHLTQTGLRLTGLDLHDAKSRTDVLDLVRQRTQANGGRPILGGGWDETDWPEPQRPTKHELDRASHGSVVYLPRVDEHGAVASSALLAAAGIDSDDGWVTLDEHHAVRRVAYASLRDADVVAAQSSATAHFASRGVAEVHECAGPQISGRGDLECLLEHQQAYGIDVVATWGDLGDVTTSRELGLRSAGGDLFCDGSLGSRTAALSAPYADDATSGHLKHGADAVAGHVLAAVQAGLGTGFHAIGDLAVDTVLAGYELARAAAGRDFDSVEHRIEHCEMASPAAIAAMARLGVVASVQPPFDATWGGPDGMYARRLGRQRALGLNPFAAFHAAGVPMLFGSDTPVCPVDPWGGVRAAVRHRTPESSIDVDTAFACHTLPLRIGGPATFAVWSVDGREDLDRTPELERLVVRGRTVAGDVVTA